MVLQGHVTNEERFLSTIAMLKANTRGFHPPHGHLNKWLREVKWQIENIESDLQVQNANVWVVTNFLS